MDRELITQIAALIRIKTPCRRLNMKYVNCLLGEVKAYFEECSFEKGILFTVAPPFTENYNTKRRRK